MNFVLSVIEDKKPRVIVVDGKCASGKTTLQEDLGKHISFSLVSMDDFFLPLELRTKSRLSERGGNVHYERFIEEVIRPLKEKKSFSYRKFSCSTNSYTGKVNVGCSGLIIVEGSYAMHPAFSRYWDIALLLTVSPSEQIRRLSLRSPDKLDMFISRWIPMENDYFSHCNVFERAQYIL